VEHKERIKNINKKVDTLSLSATPIPRTLHMSLSGIRDISVIDTPPLERLPVQTYVLEYSEGIVYDAVTRELARGGQVFFLYNRTESIESFAVKIKRIVPQAKIIIAHGQMREEALERAVEEFYAGNADVLICTTIIENGIDIANVNTLIVYEADRLGLSQLYQLRGRVGRGSRLAHVYFTYLPQKILGENAYKRLKAIMEYTELGSGFKIALRDLEIRGAGNVLGARQHGHIENVGYDMYLKLLRQSLSDEGEEAPQTEFDIAADAFIPEKYIENDAQRMKVYQRIASMEEDEKEELLKELADIYGPVGQPVLNLINIRLLKLAAQGSRAAAVIIKAGGGEIALESIDALKESGLLDAVEKFSDICSVNFSDKVRIVLNARRHSAEKMIEIFTGFFKTGRKTAR
jgi:transcription-repair coupling factor (superfamily II helicase)